MASNDKVGARAPIDQSAHATAIENVAADAPVVEKGPVLDDKETGMVEAGDLKHGGQLPSPEELVEALGIPNWRELEKKLVRRLDLTLMPCLWVLYFFNYMDRASIGQARLSTLDEDLNLTGSNFSSAVSILSLGYATSFFTSSRFVVTVQLMQHIVTFWARSPRI